MKKSLPIIAIFCAMLFGCSDMTTNTAKTESYVYYPLTQGSSWEYEAYGTPQPETSISTIAGTTMKNGKEYVNEVHNTNGPIAIGTQYLRQSNDTIYRFFNNKEQPMLIGRKGASWQFKYSDSTQYYFVVTRQTVVEELASRTVNGKEYFNVLHVKGYNTDVNAIRKDTMYFDAYYARNIGFIENNQDNGGGTRIKTYTIK